MMDNWVT